MMVYSSSTTHYLVIPLTLGLVLLLLLLALLFPLSFTIILAHPLPVRIDLPSLRLLLDLLDQQRIEGLIVLVQLNDILEFDAHVIECNGDFHVSIPDFDDALVLG